MILEFGGSTTAIWRYTYKQNNSPSYQDNNSVKVSSKFGINIHYVVNNEGKSITEELKAEGK